MKNYDAYSPKVFSVDFNEVAKLHKSSNMGMQNYGVNLARVKDKYGEDVTEFTLKEIPEHLKRNNYDSAMLLVFRRSSGEYFAKRHNNSQFLNLSA